MGQFDSSLTRVQPVFNGLLGADLTGESWLERLCEMAHATNWEGPHIFAPGPLLPAETPAAAAEREGKVFERIVPPPTAFLRWLVQHPEAMDVRDSEAFGATSENAKAWRGKLFSLAAQERQEAQREALSKLEAVGAKGSGRKWWAFEGFSHVDCCFITEKLVLFVEGKRTESVSPATLWFKQRSQLWRNVEAAREFAGGKEFGVILAVEEDGHGREAMKVAADTLSSSYPHLSDEEQHSLSNHLLGFVTWRGIVDEFGLDAAVCLPERVA